MTQASPLSRLEKLAEEYAEERCRFILSPSERDLWRPAHKASYIAGGKALLQILSESGEACGPRAWIYFKEISPGKFRVIECQHAKDAPEPGYARPTHVPIGELLQAKALEGIAEFVVGDLKCKLSSVEKALASSEARVRSLEAECEELKETIKRLVQR